MLAFGRGGGGAVPLPKTLTLFMTNVAIFATLLIFFFLIKMLYVTKQNITEKKLKTVLTILQILKKKKKRRKKLNLNLKIRAET